MGNPDLLIKDYVLVQNDYPNNAKRREVYIYYNSYLPLKVLNVVLNVEVKVDGKSVVYHHFTDYPSNPLMNLTTFFQSLKKVYFP